MYKGNVDIQDGGDYIGITLMSRNMKIWERVLEEAYAIYNYRRVTLRAHVR